MRYGDIKLGNTVAEVLRAFFSHPGEADKKPFGFDAHQRFEFFLHSDNLLYRKLPGVMIPLTPEQEEELRENVALGAVELYLCRPSAGLPPYPKTEKVILHAANGRPIPFDDDPDFMVRMTEEEMRATGIESYCQQVCGGGQCGSGPVCLYGINPETEMPPKYNRFIYPSSV